MLSCSLDGGSAGRELDLQIGGESGNFWRVVALVVMP